MGNNWDFSIIYGSSVFSSALAMDDKSDMNRQFVPMLWSLLGFKMEMVGSPFPRCNILLVLRAVLYIFGRYLMESDPRCFSGDRCFLHR